MTRDIFLGFCHECRTVEQFASRFERDHWELYHEHTEPGT